jgi:hypothetical protein
VSIDFERGPDSRDPGYGQPGKYDARIPRLEGCRKPRGCRVPRTAGSFNLA